MRISFAFLCDYAHKSGGKLSIIGIFRHFRPKEVPFTHRHFSLAFGIEMRPIEANKPHDLIIRIKGPGGDAIVTQVGKLELGGVPFDDLYSTEFAIEIGSLEFKQQGRHVIEFSTEGQTLYELAFSVDTPLEQAPAGG